MFLDVDLPEIEDLLNQSASLDADHQRLKIQAKLARQLREEYARHVHAIVLRLVGLDPIFVLEQAQLVRKMTATGMFSAITPLVPLL